MPYFHFPISRSIRLDRFNCLLQIFIHLKQNTLVLYGSMTLLWEKGTFDSDLIQFVLPFQQCNFGTQLLYTTRRNHLLQFLVLFNHVLQFEVYLSIVSLFLKYNTDSVDPLS
jgi:hypothetical protein